MKLVDKIFIDFKDIGENELNIDLTIKLWKENWFISKWHDEYSIIVPSKNNSKIKVKSNILKSQALDLIKILDLKQNLSGIFQNGSCWRL